MNGPKGVLNIDIDFFHKLSHLQVAASPILLDCTLKYKGAASPILLDFTLFLPPLLMSSNFLSHYFCSIIYSINKNVPHVHLFY